MEKRAAQVIDLKEFRAQRERWLAQHSNEEWKTEDRPIFSTGWVFMIWVFVPVFYLNPTVSSNEPIGNRSIASESSSDFQS